MGGRKYHSRYDESMGQGKYYDRKDVLGRK
jgi:hypothetical protein